MHKKYQLIIILPPLEVDVVVGAKNESEKHDKQSFTFCHSRQAVIGEFMDVGLIWVTVACRVCLVRGLSVLLCNGSVTLLYFTDFVTS